MRLPSKVTVGFELLVHKTDPNWRDRLGPKSSASGMTVCGLYLQRSPYTGQNWRKAVGPVTCTPCLEKREYRGAGEVINFDSPL